MFVFYAIRTVIPANKVLYFYFKVARRSKPVKNGRPACLAKLSKILILIVYAVNKIIIGLKNLFIF